MSLAKPCAAIVYVDRDSSGGNGTSWAQAYKTLEDAIGHTFTSEEFWIAEGTYTPSAPLLMTVGHLFYGGFAGNETARGQRDVGKHPTVVDGQNILKHVFYATTYVTNIRFDGLTIKRGNANAASGEDASGGGIIVNEGAVVIANCTFSDNKANGLGGAVLLVNNPSVTITGSTFKNNKILSDTGAGAGLAITRDPSGPEPLAIVEKCIFQGNSGGSLGGGLYSLHFPVTVKQTTFISNSSVAGGGVMFDYMTSALSRIERCLFIKNVNGGLLSFARTFIVENTVFAYNSSASSGGAVGVHSGLNTPYYNSGFSATFLNSTFYSNQAATTGGGIDNIGGHRMFIYNSIFWGNYAPGKYWQGGVERVSHDVANLGSSIGPSSMEMQYTDMETWGLADGPVSENPISNFSADPMFVEPNGSDNLEGTADDNLSIQDSSPCTDRADGNHAPATDMALRLRVDNPSVPNLGAGSPNYADIGAYEGPYYPPVVVPPPVVPDGMSLPPILHLLLSSTIFSEDFEGTWPPQGWTVVDWFSNGETWRRSDFYGNFYGVTNYCQYGSGHAAAANSYYYTSAGTGMLTSLVSPPINLFVPYAYLGYASNFQDFANHGQILLQITTDNGATWTDLRYQTLDDPVAVWPVGGTWEMEDLTPYVGHTILLRWSYYDDGAYGWFWSVDNIVIKKEPPLPSI